MQKLQATHVYGLRANGICAYVRCGCVCDVVQRGVDWGCVRSDGQLLQHGHDLVGRLAGQDGPVVALQRDDVHFALADLRWNTKIGNTQRLDSVAVGLVWLR